MKRKHVFSTWFLVGVGLVLLNTRLLLGGIPIVSSVLGLLATPGVLLSLPFIRELYT